MSETVRQDVTIKGEGNIVVGQGDVIIQPLPPAESKERRDLGTLLKNVETTWIKGVLEHSVHKAALLDLGMEMRAEAVDHPWRMVMEAPDQTRQTLPKGIKINTIFEEATQFLLILGEPGSGKTTTLLQLARDLIIGMDAGFTKPIPVILNLSTWINKDQPLADWMVAELNSKYRVPKKQGYHWLEERRILPLFDGLDEVKPENRAACVEAINILIVNYGLQGAVVCSRVQAYTALNVRLQFNHAIYLQPLTLAQIDEYFEKVGNQLASMQESLKEDEELRTSVQSPLMLNIISLAYKDSPAEGLNNIRLVNEEKRSSYLFDIYISRMFKRKGDRQADKIELTKLRLAWLAKNMQEHNQDVFLIEDMQPSWLENKWWRVFYILLSRLFGSGVFVLIQGILVGLTGNLMAWLGYGLILWMSIWLSISIVALLQIEYLNNQREWTSLSYLWRSLINIALIWLSVGLSTGLAASFRLGENVWILYGLLSIGLIFGLIFGLRGAFQSKNRDIQPVEVLHWSRDRFLIGGLVGGLVGGITATLLMLVTFNSLIFRSIDLFYYVMFGAIFLGLNRQIVETKTVPNQGIYLSARNAVIAWLFIGLSVGLFGGLVDRHVDWINMVSTYGLLGAFWYGGLDVIQHYTLRLLLIFQGYTPKNYARFLDSCVDLIFLQKVGGGYRFIHRLLLEHFAEMEFKGK